MATEVKPRAEEAIIPRDLWWAVAILIGANETNHTGTIEFEMRDGRIMSRRIVNNERPPSTPGETVRIRMSNE